MLRPHCKAKNHLRSTRSRFCQPSLWATLYPATAVQYRMLNFFGVSYYFSAWASYCYTHIYTRARAHTHIARVYARSHRALLHQEKIFWRKWRCLLSKILLGPLTSDGKSDSFRESILSNSSFQRTICIWIT